MGGVIMTNKLLWKIIIVFGIVPFVIMIINGIDAATLAHTADFDFSLFVDGILSYSAENWLTYIMGVLLILISIKHMKYE